MADLWKKEDGCVYFFKHKGIDPIKIGYSSKNDPYTRFEQFKTYAPFGAELVAFEKCSSAFFAEQTIHKKYNSKRLHGEWFNISMEEIQEEIQFIKKVEFLLHEK